MSDYIKKGRAFKFGDNISTDHIAPGRLFHLRNDLPEFAKHVLEDADPNFASNVRNGDFVVAGVAVAQGYGRLTGGGAGIGAHGKLQAGFREGDIRNPGGVSLRIGNRGDHFCHIFLYVGAQDYLAAAHIRTHTQGRGIQGYER